MHYLILKSLHIIAVISWMAGLLYAYRILVYLAERGDHPDIHALLCLMGKRLINYITIPAAVVSFVAGIAMLVSHPELMHTGWFGVKLLAVAGLVHFTAKAALVLRRFTNHNSAVPTSKTLRILNEVPTLLMIIAVVMVVCKPF